MTTDRTPRFEILESPPLDLKLIKPWDAITWVAHGTHYPARPDPLLPWYMGAENYFNDDANARASGREEMAMEILLSAIEQGRVRCVFAEKWGLDDSPMTKTVLTIIPADEMRKWQVEVEGFDFDFRPVGQPENEHWSFAAYQTLFFWSEIHALRPAEILPDTSPALEVLPFSAPPQVRREAESRGRRPKQYGAPIAAFIARCAKSGLAEALREKNETLGQWLIEEFQARQIPPPNLRNAAADARGALEAWRSAEAPAD